MIAIGNDKNDVSIYDVIQNLFPDKNKDFVININETDVALIKEVKPDIVVITGDISWYDDAKTAAILRRLKGRKVLVKGNHDDALGELSYAELYMVFDGYLELRDYETGKKCVVSHYPIHFYNGQRRGNIVSKKIMENYGKDAND